MKREDHRLEPTEAVSEENLNQRGYQKYGKNIQNCLRMHQKLQTSSVPRNTRHKNAESAVIF